MRTLFRLLTLILCVELIISPLNPSLGLIATNAFANQSCPAGQQYDSVLNRCLTKDETTKVLNATANCNGDMECYKQNAQEAFQKEVSEGNAPEKVKDQGMVGTIGKIGATAGAVTYAILGFSKAKSQCASKAFWGMIAGGVAAYAGDTLANMQHKKRLEQIKKDWGKIVNPEQAEGDKDKERDISIEAQSEAFEMLARAEDSLAQAAKMKKNVFMIATAAYAVTAALSAYEIIKEKMLMKAVAVATPESKPAAVAALSKHQLENNCKPATAAASINHMKESLYSYYTKTETFNLKAHFQLEYNLKHSKDMAALVVNTDALMGKAPSIEEYERVQEYLDIPELKEKSVFESFRDISFAVLQNLNPINSAHAEEAKGEVNTNAAKAYKEEEGKGFDFLSLGAGAVAGFAAAKMLGPKLIRSEGRLAFSGVMGAMTLMMAMHAGKQAEAATKRAELLRKMKADFMSASGAIYACKSEDRNDPGKPNCYCYTAENQRNTNRGSSQICQNLWAGISTTPTNYSSGSSSSGKVCISNTQQADPLCKCKATKSCMKVNLSGLSGLNGGTMSMLSTAIDPLNKFASGGLDAATVDSSALENSAANVKSLTDQMKKNAALTDANKKTPKLEKEIMKTLNQGSAGLSGNALLGRTSGSGFGMPSNPGEAARMLDKEIENSGPTSVSGNGGTYEAPSNSPVDPEMEFGLTQDAASAQDNQIAELMKEELDFGSATDTHPDAKANIFDVVSKRYQVSGMRRLFAEEPAAQPTAKTEQLKK
jgi:hypothetical protein